MAMGQLIKTGLGSQQALGVCVGGWGLYTVACGQMDAGFLLLVTEKCKLAPCRPPRPLHGLKLERSTVSSRGGDVCPQSLVI